MEIQLNPAVLQRGRDVIQAMVIDYTVAGETRLPAGAGELLELFIAKASECMSKFVPARIDMSFPLPPQAVQLDYVNEAVAWFTVSIQLLELEGCLEVVRRGYTPPFRFDEGEQRLFNTYHKLLKLMSEFGDAMPLESSIPLDDAQSHPDLESELEHLWTNLQCLSLRSCVCEQALRLMHRLRPESALPGRALWLSKLNSTNKEIERL